MKLLVVGATGTLGRQVARCAIDQGHQVTCLVRSLKKAAFLKEWGAQLVEGDFCKKETLPRALEGIEAVIDAATARATDSLSIKEIDWDGKVNLIQAVTQAGIKRYIFFSILDAEKYPNVPLMDIKNCTEKFLAQTNLDYTILRPCGFMQGLIGQDAIPIIENQGVWITGEGAAVAYMDTQDVAKFAVRALDVPATIGQSYPVVGSRAWKAEEIVALCERLSGQDAKVFRIPSGFLRVMYRLAYSFKWTLNIADRLAFAEVLANGNKLNAPMERVYEVFGLDQGEITTLESYFNEYFSRILKKLKEIGYEKDKNKKKQKKSPFKSKV